MAEDYFSDSPEPSSEKPSKEAKSDTDQTALLPKSFFQGKDLSVGKQCKVEIVRLLEDEAEVKYVRHNSDSKPKESEPMSDDDYA